MRTRLHLPLHRGERWQQAVQLGIAQTHMGIRGWLLLLRENDLLPADRQGGRRVPWLMSQWDPCTTNPMTGTSWRNSPLTGNQMQQCRQAMLKLPPLALSEDISFCSYSGRRGFPGLLTALGGGDAKEKLEDALGNWKAMQQMAMHYSAHDERLSFVAKWVVIMACKQTATARAKTDASGSWNFSWGKYRPAAQVSSLSETTPWSWQ